MIDAAFALAPAPDALALDLWQGDLADLAPALDGVRVLPIEPRRWWLLGAGARTGTIAAALAARGAVTPFGGGLVVATITGNWRALLSVSGFLDTERLPLGTVASTVLHHVPVRIVPQEEEQCQVFFAASFAGTLSDLWRTTLGSRD